MKILKHPKNKFQVLKSEKGSIFSKTTIISGNNVVIFDDKSEHKIWGGKVKKLRKTHK